MLGHYTKRTPDIIDPIESKAGDSVKWFLCDPFAIQNYTPPRGL